MALRLPPQATRIVEILELPPGTIFWQACGCEWQAGNLILNPVYLEATLVRGCYLHKGTKGARGLILGRTQLWVQK